MPNEPNDKEFELDDLDAFSFDDLSLSDAPDAGTDGEGEDPFGVWVKSAPEDVAPSEAGPPPDEVPPPQGLDDTPLAEDDALSSEELAGLDDSFEFVTIDDPLTEENPEADFLDPAPAAPPAPAADEEFNLDDIPEFTATNPAADGPAPTFDEVSLDDFVTFDDPPPEVSAPRESLGAPDLSPSLEEEEAEEFLDIDIDIEDDIADEELEIIEGAQPREEETEEVSADAFQTEEIDMSEFGDFGDFQEVAPQAAGPLAEGEDLPEVIDQPDLSSLDLALAEAEVPAPAAPALDAEPEIPEEAFIDIDQGFFEEEVIAETSGSLTDEGEVDLELETTLDLEADDSTDLDHIRALEEDLTAGILGADPLEGAAEAPAEADLGSEPELPSEIPPEPLDAPAAVSAVPPAAASPAAAQDTDLAALILGKIEQELSSIKYEISELKREVTHLRTVPAPEAAPEVPEPEAFVSAPEAEESKAVHGFFDEEDDETIALTGDELDNILSTAEISEGEEDGVSLDEDLLSLDPEGNLVVPEAPAAEVPAPESEEVHVTDEEFLAGTGLEVEPSTEAYTYEEADLGIPESIELEETLPEGLAEDETEDLLAPAAHEVDPLEETEAPAAEAALDIPFDADLGVDDDFTFDEDLEAPVEEPVEVAAEAEAEAEPEAVPEPAAVPAEEPVPAAAAPAPAQGGLSPAIRDELKQVLSYMDKLLASLPDDKIQEFAESEHFEVYKRLFDELGIID